MMKTASKQAHHSPNFPIKKTLNLEISNVQQFPTWQVLNGTRSQTYNSTETATATDRFHNHLADLFDIILYSA
ncbi:uncharacterized protein TNCV_4311151 [Trichonephila clavipes]|nr:uncharacterized protein TNCV_4311151 [Trichonephila clavipes]